MSRAKTAVRAASDRILDSIDEPSEKNYWLDKGYSDLGATIRESFEANSASAADCRSRMSAKMGEKDTNIVVRLFLAILNILGSVSVLIFGTLVTLIISFFHSIIIFILMTVVYVIFGITSFIDAAYRIVLRISFTCEKCKHAFALPGYVCPTCGMIHSRLFPNEYGIFVHKCTCGQKLPATFFISVKNSSGTKIRRSTLQQVCPNPQCNHSGHPGDARPESIQIVGSRSTGKTAYIAAVSHEIIEELAPSAGVTVEFHDQEKRTLYESLASSYSSGDLELTTESADINRESTFALSIYLESDSLRPSRLLHLYDIAGETFLSVGGEHEAQMQYGYEQGIVLLLDPMAIPDVRDEYVSLLNATDESGIGDEDFGKVVGALVAKAKNATNLRDTDVIDRPLAVVINKIDEAGLEKYFDSESESVYLANNPGCPKDDLQDALCREFLLSHGMGNFLNSLATNFQRYRFFACSAIGHSRNSGAFQPKDVMGPISWILSSDDGQLAHKLGIYVRLNSVPFAADDRREAINEAVRKKAARAAAKVSKP